MPDARPEAGFAPGRRAAEQLQRRTAVHRGERHRNAEAEGHAQHRLRHGHIPLGIGIDQRQHQAQHRPGDGGDVGREHQQEGHESEHGAHAQRFFHAHAPAGHRALRGALDVFVELAVGHVVDAAAGAAHEDGAGHEHQQQVQPRETARRHPEGRQRRPEQQQPAGGAVPADQIQVEIQTIKHSRTQHSDGRARESGTPQNRPSTNAGRAAGVVPLGEKIRSGAGGQDSRFTPGSSQA